MKDVKDRMARLGGELAIIVLGVSIALWAEGRIADSRQRSELHSQLRSVQAELVVARDQLDAIETVAQTEVDNLRRLAAALVGPPLPPGDSLVLLLNATLLNAVQYKPSLPALTNLSQAGQIPLIRRGELREGLALLLDLFATNESLTVLNHESPQQTMFDPFVIENFPAALEWLASTIDPEFPVNRAFSVDAEVLRTPEMRGLLAFRRSTAWVMSDHWSTLGEHMSEVIEDISRELEN